MGVLLERKTSIRIDIIFLPLLFKPRLLYIEIARWINFIYLLYSFQDCMFRTYICLLNLLTNSWVMLVSILTRVSDYIQHYKKSVNTWRNQTVMAGHKTIMDCQRDGFKNRHVYRVIIWPPCAPWRSYQYRHGSMTTLDSHIWHLTAVITTALMRIPCHHPTWQPTWIQHGGPSSNQPIDKFGPLFSASAHVTISPVKISARWSCGPIRILAHSFPLVATLAHQL